MFSLTEKFRTQKLRRKKKEEKHVYGQIDFFQVNNKLFESDFYCFEGGETEVPFVPQPGMKQKISVYEANIQTEVLFFRDPFGMYT